ncbi:MAG: hypothetical protein IPK19_30580 [Chloroflexi bacterium]|nr:hypothetical protein [Chloroflexota bacterium]
MPATIPPDYVFSAESQRSQINSAGGKLSIVAGRTQIGLLSASAHELHLQVQVFTPTTLELFTAPFPGWTAQLGNQQLELHSNPEQPLLHVDLQQGQRGELALTLGATPPRLFGWLLTWVGCWTALVLVLRWRTRGDHEAEQIEFALLNHAEARLFGVLMLGVVGLLALSFALPELAAAGGWQIAPGTGLAGVQPLNIRSDAGLELIGYRADSGRIAQGSTLEFTLYWRTLRSVEANYRAQIAFQDRSTGRVDSLSAIRHPGDLPTTRWLPRRYVVDTWRIPIPDTLSPGDYDLVLTLFSCDALCEERQSVTLFASDGAPIGTVLALPLSTSIVSK